MVFSRLEEVVQAFRYVVISAQRTIMVFGPLQVCLGDARVLGHRSDREVVETAVDTAAKRQGVALNRGHEIEVQEFCVTPQIW